MSGMDGYPVVVDLEVRYRDLDPLGHVNNAVYLSYIEHARVPYFELLGLARGAFGEGAAPVVARAEIDYLRPVFLGQRVRVGARIVRLGRTSFTMAYLVAADGKPAARAKTVHVMVAGREKVPLSPELRARIAGLEKLPVEGLEE
jgi:acyl-CoA thioester hydrolase